MPTIIPEPLDGGLVTARDKGELGPGQLQQATGIWYRPGDNRAWKLRGRSEFDDTGSGTSVVGVKLCQFDSGTDYLVALSGTVLYGATPGTTGTFASLATGLTDGANALKAAHYNDRWYLTNSLDAMRVLEDDGTVRLAGMLYQQTAPGLTAAAAGGTEIRPGTPSGAISDGANTMDSSQTTFGAIVLDAAGSTAVTWSGTGWTGAAATRQLVVSWALSAMPIRGDGGESGTFDDTGGGITPDILVAIKFELSTDAGVNYTTIMQRNASLSISIQTLQYPVTADPDNVVFKATLTYTSGSREAALRIYDVRMQTGSATANFSTTTGIYYAVSEFDETRGLLSVASPEKLVTLATQNQVTVDLSGYTARNSNATHWVIWRTADGGVVPHQLGWLASIKIDQTSFVDDFVKYGPNDQPALVYPTFSITVDQGTLRIDRDTPPPTMNSIRTYKGSLVGVKGRRLRYSMPGFPESWPEAYVIDAFPLEEHDQLLDTIDLGSVLVIAAEGAMLRVDELPRFFAGQFNAGSAEKIAGAPGCVGRKAITYFAVAGESLAAWISHYGVYVTNGFTFRRLSDNLDWGEFEGLTKSGWSLHWDPDRFVLIMDYAESGSTNNRSLYFHVHPDHSGKITGPHYDKCADRTSGQVGSQRRMYSAHPSNGIVYLEDSGATDAAENYNSDGDLPLIVQTRRIYGDDDWAALGCWLQHTDFGSGETATVAWTAGRDASGHEETKSQSVSLEGHERTQFDIARSGSWHEATITHEGAATGALVGLRIEVRGAGKPGKVAVA